MHAQHIEHNPFVKADKKKLISNEMLFKHICNYS